MADSITSEQRSWNMSQIRSRDTTPEMVVRSILHRSGFRFRLHRKELPGKPDIVLRKHRAVIFVHGCFWHRHSGCKRCSTPKTNPAYWIPKLQRNADRDREHIANLKKLGWRVRVVWECELKNQPKLTRNLENYLQKGARVRA
ncbi:MAG: very short patch repair endonuclease [Pyrinomonadaceae bacterium]